MAAVLGEVKCLTSKFKEEKLKQRHMDVRMCAVSEGTEQHELIMTIRTDSDYNVNDKVILLMPHIKCLYIQ